MADGHGRVRLHRGAGRRACRRSALRPITTARAPSSGTSYSASIAITPGGVGGHEPRPAEVQLARVERMRAVDVLVGVDRAEAPWSRRCRREAAAARAPRRRRRRRSARRPSRAAPASEMEAGSRRSSARIPASVGRLVLEADVDLARPDRRRRAPSSGRGRRAADLARDPRRRRAASAFPSMSVAVTRPTLPDRILALPPSRVALRRPAANRLRCVRWPRKNDPGSIRARQEMLGVDGLVTSVDLEPFTAAAEALTGVAVIPVSACPVRDRARARTSSRTTAPSSRRAARRRTFTCRSRTPRAA